METNMSEELVVRCCASTLASLKTGSLFNCKCSSREELYEKIRNLNKRMCRKGLRIMPLRFHSGTALVYVYQSKKRQKDLMNETACRLLNDHGYPCGQPTHCLIRLKERLEQNTVFPHEIGLFLGYPPEDVDGFIHRKDEAKCSGCWKVYGDVENAKKHLPASANVRQLIWSNLKKGRGLNGLL